MVEKAANAKKNIFCEKPLALNNEDAERMDKAIKRNKVKSMVGHVLRFWPEYIKAKEVIESGVLGKPLNIYCERLGVLPKWTEDDWNKEVKLGGGGAVLDLQIHDLDFLIYYYYINTIGEPINVSSNGFFDQKLGGWAHMNSVVNFKNGKVGLVNAVWIVKGVFPFTIVFRIFCEDGTIEWIFRAGEEIPETLDGKAKKSHIRIYKSDGQVVEKIANDIDPFYLEWKYFIDSLNANTEVKNSTINDGKISLRLALATIKSAKDNKKVEF